MGLLNTYEVEVRVVMRVEASSPGHARSLVEEMLDEPMGDDFEEYRILGTPEPVTEYR